MTNNTDPCSNSNCVDSGVKHWHSNSPEFIFVESELSDWELDA